MVKKHKILRLISKMICLMSTVLVLFLATVGDVYASETGVTDDGLTNVITDILGGATGETATDSENETNDSGAGLSIDINTGSKGNSLTSTLQILLLLTIISLAPSILIMVTSFTRIVIVMHFIRTAIGTQTAPPNQVLVGLSLFLTFFIMSPVFSQINTEAIKPLEAGTITTEQAIETGLDPIREFMFDNTRAKDLNLFLDMADIDSVESYKEIPTTVLIPAFMISELRTAFIIGFLIYLPFIVIDMVVASTLMSMGMMMLPPTTVSLPFKILLFVLADGWNLVIGSLVKSFH